jgi:hypothetical protein
MNPFQRLVDVNAYVFRCRFNSGGGGLNSLSLQLGLSRSSPYGAASQTPMPQETANDADRCLSLCVGKLDLGEACSTECNKPLDKRNGSYCTVCQLAMHSQNTTRRQVSRVGMYRPPPRKVPSSLEQVLATTRLGEQELRCYYCKPNRRLENTSILNPSIKRQKSGPFK